MSSIFGRVGSGIAKVAGVGISAITGGGIGALGSILGGPKPFNFPSMGGPINMPFPVKGPGGVNLPGYNPAGSQNCPRGYHLNKKPLAACKKHGAVGARSICVRNRSMNPMNWRALTKSMKRVKRAQKIVRKLHSFAPVRHSLPRGRPIAISENLRITSGK